MTISEQAQHCSFGLAKTFFSRTSKSAFCLSTSLKAPCRRFPILAMTMFEQARHCSFGLTKTFTFRILAQICPCWHRNIRNMKKCSFTFSSFCATDCPFSTCRECTELPPQLSFLLHNCVLSPMNMASSQILLYLCPVLRTWEGCLSWFYSTAIIYSSQFEEILKV